MAFLEEKSRKRVAAVPGTAGRVLIEFIEWR